MGTRSILSRAIQVVMAMSFSAAAMAGQPVDNVQSDAAGNTAMGGYHYAALADLTTGAYNTASGEGALTSDSNGGANTAHGDQALFLNLTAVRNTGSGSHALCGNVSGTDNTAVGYYALLSVTEIGNTALGSQALGALAPSSGCVGAVIIVGPPTPSSSAENTATGFQALNSDLSGTNNTATGANALGTLVIGSQNTGVGAFALDFENGTGNTASGSETLAGGHTTGASGSYNTASGFAALGANGLNNGMADHNTAFGSGALLENVSGYGNAAQGYLALFNSSTGARNLGIGSDALYTNISGSYNVAFGFGAGYNTLGNDNIYLANAGGQSDSQSLHLGTQGTTDLIGSGILRAYIAGVAGSQVTGSAVFVTSSGQLGVLASAERFKTDMQTMAEASKKLEQLRPVTFRLKTDATKTLQYGLIAEEVAKTYPELVIHGADGRIDGVRYEELAPMILNEARQLQREIAELTQLNQMLQAATEEMQTRDMRVAMRR